jgi:hypothetical protein
LKGENRMASNRLFIYDPATNKAVCIAKGYSVGWYSGEKYLDDWFDENVEYNTGEINKTRFELKTEYELSNEVNITWGNMKKNTFINWLINKIKGIES